MLEVLTIVRKKQSQIECWLTHHVVVDPEALVFVTTTIFLLLLYHCCSVTVSTRNVWCETFPGVTDIPLCYV